MSRRRPAPRKKIRARRLGEKFVMVRFSVENYGTIRKAAEQRGLRVSSYIEMDALAQALIDTTPEPQDKFS